MFKDSFKYYKSRDPPPDLSDVIDLRNHVLGKVKRVGVSSNEGFSANERLGLKSPSNWEIFEFYEIPGLIYIKNPFTSDGQRYWISKCLRDYSCKPNKLNIDAHNLLEEGENWWDVCANDTRRGKDLALKLRWATLGYHHNWDTKVYAEDSRGKMPLELSEMTGILAKFTGFPNFKAEAAIVNYYRMNSTLAGHTDHSEIDREAPLFSISFGQSAIFLIGGLTQIESAHALFLHSGDVLVMAGGSRLRYHGVPKILHADKSPWDSKDNMDEIESLVDWKKARTYISQARININVRQVLKCGQTTLKGENEI
ncbi:nucleic acid dioxygenase ALKBH1 [Venturia canescens]|uniref:nucleic acid dioxygenase ALKBH1 n=1 Tax=Venturia canescens TaxID=32260 RepID=UPI001C9D3285|nr:nucleic acid dioxygenase ALKBH1 [Venturia canescens]